MSLQSSKRVFEAVGAGASPRKRRSGPLIQFNSIQFYTPTTIVLMDLTVRPTLQPLSFIHGEERFAKV